jgi:gluconolactonase
VVYFADTHTARLYACDIERPGVLIKSNLAPGKVIGVLPGNRALDSLAVEAGGKICVATVLDGGISVFDPDGTVEHLGLPDPVTTNICFGGADMRDAWITCSGTGTLYKCRWPRPGLRLNYQN